MRKRESLIKSRLISFILALGLLLSLTITGMAASSSNVQDGLEVSISTDKDKYSETESIKVTLTVKNTNSFSVEDVKLVNLIPEGYELDKASAANKSVGLLKSGETVTLDSLLIKPVNNANPSSNNSSSNANNSNSAENRNNQSTTNRNTASNSTSNNKTTSTTKKAKVVYTGDNSQLLLWVGIALSSLFGVALALWLKKKKDGNGKAILSLFLAGSLIATTLTLSSFNVNAEDSANSNVGVIEISTNALVNSKALSLDGKVTYNKEHLKNESINRYQWIKMLIEKLEYDFDAIADQPQVFEDVSEDNEYYPYVQAAALWDIIDKEGKFDGEQLATESFVGITGVRSIGPARLESIFLDKEKYSDNDIFAVALQNNIAMGPENSVVSEASCADRLNNIMDFMFSDAANQDYENIVFKDSVIQLPDNYPYSENESGIMTITDVDDKTITVGDIVSFHTEDGTFLAGKVTSVSDENGKSVLQMEEVSPEEVFVRYEGVVTSELTAEMMWDYYETLSIPEDEESVNKDNNSNSNEVFQQTSFDPSKDFDVETLLNQSSDTITPTPLADIYPNDIEVKIDFSFDINEAKFKIKAAVKDLNSGITKNFNLSPDKLIKKDSFEFEEDEKDEISFSLKLKMENVKTRVATSLINATKRKPIAEVSLIGDFTFSVKGGFKGGLDIPIPGLGFSAFEESSTLTSKILNTSNVGIGLFISLNVEGELEVSYSAPSTKIMSGVYLGSGIRNYSSLKDYPPEFEATKVVAKGEVGLKAKLEFVLMQNKKGFELKADYFAGPALKAEITAHKTYCTCVDGTMYLSLHGDATARIDFGIKFNYKLEFPKIDETNPPRLGGTDNIIKLHFEDYYNTPEKDWIKVEECTYKEGTGNLNLEVSDYYSNKPVEGALISVYKNDDLIEAVHADKDGKYSINLPHDRYKIVVTKEGYLENSTIVDVPIDEELDLTIGLMKLDSGYVFFGSYPIESEDASPTPIRWRIIHDDGTYYTLMMDPVLFTSDYSGSWSEASWANSNMREFLNGDFYQKAFNSSEQTDIVDTTISFWSYKEGAGYSYDTTVDKVYILSTEEYMNPDYGFSNTGEPSDTRIPHYNEKSIYLDVTTHFGDKEEFDSENKTTWVWTRDVHANNFGFPMPTYVTTDGGIYSGGQTYSTWHLGLQPVIRVKSNSNYVKTSTISF